MCRSYGSKNDDLVRRKYMITLIAYSAHTRNFNEILNRLPSLFWPSQSMTLHIKSHFMFAVVQVHIHIYLDSLPQFWTLHPTGMRKSPTLRSFLLKKM